MQSTRQKASEMWMELMTEMPVPQLRGLLIEAVTAAQYAKTQKEREARLAAAFAYGKALSLLKGTELWIDGITPTIGDQYWSNEVELARVYLGGAVDLLGEWMYNL